MYVLPVSWGKENNVLENLQLLILLCGIITALKVKTEKPLFIFASLILSILFFREISWGRSVFLTIPGHPDDFGRWEHVPYGFLVLWFFKIYMLGILGYFFWKKIYLTIWKIIKTIPFPFWAIMFLALGTLGNYAGEKFIDNEILEEMSEILVYSTLVCLIFSYSKKLKR